jgi:hypothetical protein
VRNAPKPGDPDDEHDDGDIKNDDGKGDRGRGCRGVSKLAPGITSGYEPSSRQLADVRRYDRTVLQAVVPQLVAIDGARALRQAIADPDRFACEPKVDGVRGLLVQVPVFVETGDMIRIDTQTGKYQTRV